MRTQGIPNFLEEAAYIGQMGFEVHQHQGVDRIHGYHGKISFADGAAIFFMRLGEEARKDECERSGFIGKRNHYKWHRRRGGARL